MILQVGVKVFLGNKHGHWLLLYRTLEKSPDVSGGRDMVGSRIVPGSKLKENLRREVKEETGLEIISEPVLIAAQDIMPDGDKHVVRLTYTAETEGEPVLNTSENTDYKWMLKEEIEALDDLDIYAKDALKAISHPIKV